MFRPKSASFTVAPMKRSSSLSTDLLFVLLARVSFSYSSCFCSNSAIFGAPAAILASALLSTSGVFLALLITGTTFNISSFMGLIMVIGIVAKNGILLLDADHSFSRRGLLRARTP